MSNANNLAKAVAIIGMTGTGKNFNLEQFFLKRMPTRKKYIADVSNQYGIPFNGIDEFMSKLVKTETVIVDGEKKKKKTVKVKDSLIAIDEATLFFDSHRAEDLEYLLIQKRHSGETGNFIVLLFHSLADFPKYIKRKIDYIILLKTADDLPSVIAKFGSDSPITIAFKELQQEENKHARRIVQNL